MAEEERDIPTLDTLGAEIDTTSERLDQEAAHRSGSGVPVTAEQVLSELRNTFLPLLKDVVASVSLDLLEIRDIVDPIKLTTPDAEEIEALLQAFKASRPTDAALAERVDAALGLLQPGDDEDEGDDEEAETN